MLYELHATDFLRSHSSSSCLSNSLVFWKRGVQFVFRSSWRDRAPCDILQHARSLWRGIVRHGSTEPTGWVSHTAGYQRLISQFDVHLLQKFIIYFVSQITVWQMW